MKYLCNLLLSLLLGGAAVSAAAQPFVSFETGIRPTLLGTLSLGDLDADGDLDVLITGGDGADPTPVMKVYRNDGPSPEGLPTFTDVRASFASSQAYLSTLRAATVDLGDYDNDGDLDVLLASTTGVVVYRNHGAFLFTAIPIARLERTGSTILDLISTPSAAWGDYDNDGRLDVLVTGRNKTAIYRNAGNDLFTESKVGLPTISNGSVAWGDYDNDGDLDVLVAHRPLGESPATFILRNDRNKVFVNGQAGLPGIETGSVRWGDYDNDGDLDVLVTGSVRTTPAGLPTGNQTLLYRNDNGGFTLTDAALPFAWYGDWIDYDNDGDLDLLLDGTDAGRSFFKVIRNDNGRFHETVAQGPGITYGAVATGDLDGDGGLDVVMSGRLTTLAGAQTRFLWYRNTAAAPNERPSAPGSLSATRNGDVLTLVWSTASDDTTPAQALNYNLRVGTTPGGADVLAPMSAPQGGRLLPGRGNAGGAQRWTLRGLDPARTYYWSVQTIDRSLTASGFAVEQAILAAELPRRPEDEPIKEPILLDNYPNPFNPSTTIRYTLPEAVPVRVVVYTMLGAEVAVLADGVQAAGRHEVRWEGRDAAGRPVPSGLYVYTLVAGAQKLARTMVLLK